jgi:predicted ATPase
MTNLRFILTGGPGAGKTTVLEALAERGYQYVPETARAIIKERLEAGLSPRPPLAQFGQDILQRDITYYWETVVTDKPVFFDRGVIDALGLLYEAEAISPAEVEVYLREFPYNEMVFLLPPWESIYRTDAQRDQGYSEAVQVFERLRAWYGQWGYKPVEVPRVEVERRVAFILETVETTLANFA